MRAGAVSLHPLGKLRLGDVPEAAMSASG